MPSMGGGAADGLQQVLTRLFAEAQFKQLQKQQALQAAAQSRSLDQGDQRIGLDRDELGQRTRAYDTTRADAQAAAAAEQAAATKASAELEAFEGQMPEHLRGAYHASGHKSNFKPEDFVNAPETLDQQGERALKQETGKSKIIEGRELRLINARPKPESNERLVQVQGPNGSPIWVRESDAVGKPAAQAARAVTGQERGVLAYYNRAKDASDTMASPDKSGTSLEDRVAKGGIGAQVGLQYAPNWAQSSDQQAYRQSQRTFTEARLRKESGAAIPEGEYENDAKTYFAQPGDDPKTIDLKRQKRQTVLEGLKFSSGKAYDEFFGGDGPGAPTPGGAPKGVKILSIKPVQ
jgi:hypothetical protein